MAGPRLRRLQAPAGAPEALLEGQVRRVVYSEKEGDELQGEAVLDEDLFGGVSRGGLTLYEKGGVARVARAIGEGISVKGEVPRRTFESFQCGGPEAGVDGRSRRQRR